ncbi:hypothetical protein [Sphingopyxis sp.]|uniref:hypothetical protein n=1 Tax=Sphingopyxis sp. TaxID=1908224 RepID=UPI002FC99A76
MKLLNEKFSIDWAFHSFRGQATNCQIADNYTREDRDPAVKRAAKSVEAFFDLLDKEHAKTAAKQPVTVPGQPIQVGPHDAGVHPRYAPVNHPWRNQFPTIPRNSLIANPSGRYRPATMSPFNPNRWGANPIIRSPNFGTQPRTIAPAPASRSTYMDSIRHGINPITRDIMGGRIQPTVRPSYIQPRPAALQRGGSGWDPSRFGFGTQTMNLMDRWRPDRRIMVPTQYGSSRYEFKGLIDRGSRDF